MRQFIEKYPRDAQVYYAYNSIAQNASAGGKPEDAISAYVEFAQRYSENPKAAEALAKTAELQRGNAGRIAANYLSLNEADRTRWKEAVDSAVTTSEEMLAKYPATPDLAACLQPLFASQHMLVRAELKTDAQAEEYFQQLAGKAADAGAASKILFALGGYIAEKDKGRAFTVMSGAYDPALVYSPKDMDVYGLALVENKKLDQASAVFKKLAADFAVPPGTPATLDMMEAQAISIFGLGRIAQENKQTAEAGKLFQQLKVLYPWSPKVLEADYGIAESLRADGKLDEALQLLPAIIRAQNGSADLRANAFLLAGSIMKQKSAAESDPKKKIEFRGQAIDFFAKIAQYYPGVSLAATEGLWQSSQLLEEQAGASSDVKFKAQQLERAKTFYKQLVKDYPDSPYAPKAKERLTALGVP